MPAGGMEELLLELERLKVENAVLRESSKEVEQLKAEHRESSKEVERLKAENAALLESSPK